MCLSHEIRKSVKTNILPCIDHRLCCGVCAMILLCVLLVLFTRTVYLLRHKLPRKPKLVHVSYFIFVYAWIYVLYRKTHLITRVRADRITAFTCTIDPFIRCRRRVGTSLYPLRCHQPYIYILFVCVCVVFGVYVFSIYAWWDRIIVWDFTLCPHEHVSLGWRTHNKTSVNITWAGYCVYYIYFLYV